MAVMQLRSSLGGKELEDNCKADTCYLSLLLYGYKGQPSAARYPPEAHAWKVGVFTEALLGAEDGIIT